jgi:hypothetical protein
MTHAERIFQIIAALGFGIGVLTLGGAVVVFAATVMME